MSNKSVNNGTDSYNGLKSHETKVTRGLLCKLRMATSLEDIRSLMFWKAIFAEFLGTWLLVLIGTGSCIQDWQEDTLDVVQIALSFGLTVATIVWIIGHISGGHINPAVTCAMLITRRISLIRALLFITAQLVGAIIGSALLKAFTPEEMRGFLGVTKPATGVTEGMAVGTEFFITFTLVLTVFASCDTNRTDLKGSFPLTIGLSVTMAHMWAVYWVGPLCGGMVAGLVYDNILTSNASLRKARDMLMSSRYNEEKYPVVVPKIRVIEADNEEQEALPV